MIEDELKILTIETDRVMPRDRLNMIEKRFKSMIGIKLLSCTEHTLKIEYFAHLFSEQVIRDELSDLGVTAKKKKKEGFLKKLINYISKENARTFGGKRIDCCDLNHS